MELNKAINEVVVELGEATQQFGAFYSPHEGLAVILEEYEELKAEVFKQFDVRTKEKLRKEAKHVASMAIRFMMDLT